MHVRRFLLTRRLLAAALFVAVAFALPPGAMAATGDLGSPGPSFSGAYLEPSGSKPQSKLWYADGAWWGVLFDSPSSTFRIHRLEPASATWVDTGTVIDTRVNSRSDVLFDGTRLYVATHRYSKTTGSGYPARLLRFSYDGVERRWTLDAGFPTQINNVKTEALVIDKDSTGRLWATWTQGRQVYVNRTVGGDSTWGTPFPIAAGLNDDDIATVVAFGGNSTGVMWGNQDQDAYLFSVHRDGDPDTAWTAPEAIVSGPGIADDHINVKAASDGRLFAVVKTNLKAASDPLILLLVRSTAGTWTQTVVSTDRYSHTRPILTLDEDRREVHVLMTGPQPPNTNGQKGGDIYEKVASMDAPSFSDGYGTAVMRIAGTADLDDVTSTKQPVGAGSGLVAIAGSETADRYWMADIPLGSAPPQEESPVASFTASPTSGTAPLAVSFTDTSTGPPTSWEWDFGDGSTSTWQHPTHTFGAAGTYTVTLTATNGAGSSAASTTIAVQPSPSSGTVTVAPSEDAYVNSSRANTNAGASAYLRAAAGTATYRSYLKFPVSGLTGSVQRAVLRLYATSSAPAGVIVTSATNAWSEGTVTWTNAPAPAAGSLATMDATASGTWYEIDITPAIAADGTYTLVLAGGTSTSAWFSSRQGPNPPQLVITTG